MTAVRLREAATFRAAHPAAHQWTVLLGVRFCVRCGQAERRDKKPKPCLDRLEIRSRTR